MSIRINCSCGATTLVGDEYAGRTGKCRKCNALIMISHTGNASTLPREESALPHAGESSNQCAPAASLSEAHSSHSESNTGTGTSETGNEGAQRLPDQERQSKIEAGGELGEETSTWHVMTGVVNKTFHEDEAMVLQQSGKVRIRGPLTEDTLRKHFKSGNISANSIIKKSGEVIWKPLHSHDDVFPKSLQGLTATKYILHVFHSSFVTSVSALRRRPEIVAAVILSICLLMFVRYLYFERLNPVRHPEKYITNVVTIYNGKLHVRGAEELGKGFFVKPSGLLVTCMHVIGHTNCAIVKDVDGKFHTVESVVHINLENDLAIVKVSSLLPHPMGLELAESGTVKAGDDAFVLGRGKSVDDVVIESILDVDPLSRTRRSLYRLVTSINDLSNGGPVLDKYGRVIGVTTTGLRGHNVYNSQTTFRSGPPYNHMWKYQDKIVIPISPLNKPGVFNGLEYNLFTRKDEWKLFSTTKWDNPGYELFVANQTSEYELNSVTDLGNGFKRVWAQEDRHVYPTSMHNPYERERLNDAQYFARFLWEVDCNTHQRRTNIDSVGYNFAKNNEWRPVEPGLEKEICSGH